MVGMGGMRRSSVLVLAFIVLLAIAGASVLAYPDSPNPNVEIIAPKNGQHLEVGPITIVARISEKLVSRSSLVNVCLDDEVLKGFLRQELLSNISSTAEGERFVTISIAANIEKPGAHTISVVAYNFFMGETGGARNVVVAVVPSTLPVQTNQTKPSTSMAHAYRVEVEGVAVRYPSGEAEDVNMILYCGRIRLPLLSGEKGASIANSGIQGVKSLPGDKVLGGIMSVGGSSYWINGGYVLGHDGITMVKLEGEAKAVFISIGKAKSGYEIEGVLKAGWFLGTLNGSMRITPIEQSVIPLNETGLI